MGENLTVSPAPSRPADFSRRPAKGVKGWAWGSCQEGRREDGPTGENWQDRKTARRSGRPPFLRKWPRPREERSCRLGNSAKSASRLPSPAIENPGPRCRSRSRDAGAGHESRPSRRPDLRGIGRTRRPSQLEYHATGSTRAARGMAAHRSAAGGSLGHFIARQAPTADSAGRPGCPSSGRSRRASDSPPAARRSSGRSSCSGQSPNRPPGSPAAGPAWR